MISEQWLSKALEQVEKEHRLSRALLVSQDGNVVFEKVYGFASRQLHVPNVLETTFHFDRRVSLSQLKLIGECVQKGERA